MRAKLEKVDPRIFGCLIIVCGIVIIVVVCSGLISLAVENWL